MPAIAGAESFTHDGSTDVGVLLSHGFTGSPFSMRPWADHLVAEGYSVRLPLLPGHGTDWREMNRTGWPQWYGELESALADLRARCDTVFVFGLSMGGALALRLAQEHPDVAGLALVNPSVMTLRKEVRFVPLLSRVVRSVAPISDDIAKPGVSEHAYGRTPLRALASLAKLWGTVRRDLPKVTQPVLVLHSAVDHVVEPENSAIVLAEVSSTDVTEVVLDNSHHVATLDHDAPVIFARSVEFIRRVRAERAGDRV
ncbi:putative esterase/lipase [Actinokineospora spheciospongiae]|uniref:Putative esterase/lipase n=1 Tax=Actinokineospora spheciospongiae TaxID=909613 RepID=W7J4V6_9PSEU|nr:alpha/beta fold hydrolase [Actinokineospora spheciospongiae]EWC64051.1 putative esterase/lipase [Actinokineospora spheciospongiae]PWW58404.1 esterase/lipase [Actinokineospora spheciospongiae]